MSKFIDFQILKQFKDKGYFDRDALIALLVEFDPEITESSLTWRIHDLLKRNVIDQIKLGIFSISNRKKYSPEISQKLVQLAKIVSLRFDDLDYCIWSTEWLNDFTQHQLGSFFYIVEVEKDFVEEVFNAYSELKQFRVYLASQDEIFERYTLNEYSVIIKPLISRSPKKKVLIKNKYRICIPSIEKILVDVYSDPITFYSIQGSELETIFENAIKRYLINFTKLISYAKRRTKEVNIQNYLLDNFEDLVKDILE